MLGMYVSHCGLGSCRCKLATGVALSRPVTASAHLHPICTVFKQQNSVHGMPLELSEEETTLALERGWAVLRAAPAVALHVARLQATCRKRPRDHMGYCEEEEVEEAAACAPGDDSQWDPHAPLPPEPEWRRVLKEGARLVVPDTPEELAAAMPAAAAAAGEAGAPPEQLPAWTFPATTEERHRYWIFRDLHSRGMRITGGSKFGADYLVGRGMEGPCVLGFAAATERAIASGDVPVGARCRFQGPLAFTRLRSTPPPSQVYPGDPTLYHAQFCLRVVPYRQPLLAANLAAATRGSAMARKHLLLASVVEGGDLGGRVSRPADGSLVQPASEAASREAAHAAAAQYKIHYMTLGPVDGFAS